MEELREVVDIYLLTRTDMIDLCLMLACPYIYVCAEDVMICHIKKNCAGVLISRFPKQLLHKYMSMLVKLEAALLWTSDVSFTAFSFAFSRAYIYY